MQWSQNQILQTTPQIDRQILFSYFSFRLAARWIDVSQDSIDNSLDRQIDRYIDRQKDIIQLFQFQVNRQVQWCQNQILYITPQIDRKKDKYIDRQIDRYYSVILVPNQPLGGATLELDSTENPLDRYIDIIQLFQFQVSHQVEWCQNQILQIDRQIDEQIDVQIERYYYILVPSQPLGGVVLELDLVDSSLDRQIDSIELFQFQVSHQVEWCQSQILQITSQIDRQIDIIQLFQFQVSRQVE